MIRKARESDSKKIYELAKSLSITNLKDNTKGFLVYVLPKKEYLKRIKISKNFYVSENNNQINGFLMCYDKETLKKMQQKGILAHEDNIINIVQQDAENYLFGDQIGISRLAQEKKSPIGIQIMNYLFEEMKKQNIKTMYVAILHKPKLNIKSKQFCIRIGFKQIKEVKNTDNTIWGIYKYTF